MTRPRPRVSQPESYRTEAIPAPVSDHPPVHAILQSVRDLHTLLDEGLIATPFQIIAVSLPMRQVLDQALWSSLDSSSLSAASR
jgi:hypothetical protein